MRKTLLGQVLAIVMVITMMTSFGFASEFTDMPQDWSTEALEQGIENGLFNGSDGQINPNANLTRAELATVINRAFGATNKASLEKYTDVEVNSWYYDEMAKAVKMNAFKGDGDKLNPTKEITREETFTVIARVLDLDEVSNSLDKFTDKTDVSLWAKDSLSALVSAGYVNGTYNNLNPKGNITRAEFAQVMHNIIKDYKDVADTYTEVVEGNIMINVADVILKDLTIKGDLIIGDGVGAGNVTLDGVIVEGRMVVRGGGINSIIIKGSSKVSTVVVTKVDGGVRILSEGDAIVETVFLDDGKDEIIIEGKFGNLVVGANVKLLAKSAILDRITLTGEKSSITIDKKSTVKDVLVNKTAENTNLKVEGIVNSVKIEAANTSIEGKGKVESVKVQANDVTVNTVGTKLEVVKDVTGTTSGGKKVEANTTGTTSTSGGVTVPTTPTPGPSTGGSTGGGGSVTPTPSEPTTPTPTAVEVFEGLARKINGDVKVEGKVIAIVEYSKGDDITVTIKQDEKERQILTLLGDKQFIDKIGGLNILEINEKTLNSDNYFYIFSRILEKFEGIEEGKLGELDQQTISIKVKAQPAGYDPVTKDYNIIFK